MTTQEQTNVAVEMEVAPAAPLLGENTSHGGETEADVEYTENGKPLEYVTFNEDGPQRRKMRTEDIAPLVEFKAREMAGGIKLSRARQEMEEMTGGEERPMPILQTEFEGKKYFTLKADFERLSLIMMLTPRDAHGRLILTQHGVLKSLLRAMLYTCRVCGLNDRTPFYENIGEAEEMASRTDEVAVGINNHLFMEILDHNPSIWPDGAKQARDARKEREADSADPLALST